MTISIREYNEFTQYLKAYLKILQFNNGFNTILIIYFIFNPLFFLLFCSFSSIIRIRDCCSLPLPPLYSTYNIINSQELLLLFHSILCTRSQLSIFIPILYCIQLIQRQRILSQIMGWDDFPTLYFILPTSMKETISISLRNRM